MELFTKHVMRRSPRIVIRDEMVGVGLVQLQRLDVTAGLRAYLEISLWDAFLGILLRRYRVDLDLHELLWLTRRDASERRGGRPLPKGATRSIMSDEIFPRVQRDLVLDSPDDRLPGPAVG